MKTFQEHLNTYNEEHLHAGAKITHYIGIPAIMLSVLMLLNWMTLVFAGRWGVSFAWIVLVAVLVYYYRLNVKLAMATTVVGIIFTFVAALLAGTAPTQFSVILLLVLFIGGWILLFIGHLVFAKNKPAFTKSATQVLIAPLFFVLALLGVIGLKQYFT